MRVGILLNDLGQSQASFMAISFANTLIAQKLHTDISIFCCDTVSPVIKPMCLVSSIDRIHGFDGMLIATDLYLASLLKSVSAPKKLLYLWDLQWLRDYNAGNYLENLNILREPSLDIIARSDTHAAAIQLYSNKSPVDIIPNFNLLTIINKYNSNEKE